jgi:hypothetical protein
MAKASVDGRQLKDLRSIGPAMLRDFKLLGIVRVEQLAKCEASSLYEKLCRVTGVRQDPCVLDTFSAAVAQARDPALPAEQCDWWYWSRVRKGQQRPNPTAASRPSARRELTATVSAKATRR